jgi:G3E family GTPase
MQSSLAHQMGNSGQLSSVSAAAAAEGNLSGSHRHIAELLLEQIEAADVLLLNKADTVQQEELQLLQVSADFASCSQCLDACG